MKFCLKFNIFVQEKALESVICKMATILSRPQWVNMAMVLFLSLVWYGASNSPGFLEICCFRIREIYKLNTSVLRAALRQGGAAASIAEYRGQSLWLNHTPCEQYFSEIPWNVKSYSLTMQCQIPCNVRNISWHLPVIHMLLYELLIVKLWHFHGLLMPHWITRVQLMAQALVD